MVYSLIFWTWCLPQSFLGFLIFIFCALTKNIKSVEIFKNVIIIETSLISGLSFGQFIFLEDVSLTSKILKHEYGHTIQNYIFGWLYLIIIGIPSFVRAIIWKIKKLPNRDYYKGWSENWADKLGKVRRK